MMRSIVQILVESSNSTIATAAYDQAMSLYTAPSKLEVGDSISASTNLSLLRSPNPTFSSKMKAAFFLMSTLFVLYCLWHLFMALLQVIIDFGKACYHIFARGLLTLWKMVTGFLVFMGTIWVAVCASHMSCAMAFLSMVEWLHAPLPDRGAPEQDTKPPVVIINRGTLRDGADDSSTQSETADDSSTQSIDGSEIPTDDHNSNGEEMVSFADSDDDSSVASHGYAIHRERYLSMSVRERKEYGRMCIAAWHTKEELAKKELAKMVENGPAVV